MGVEFVYLASGSPRRRQLLEQIGVPFQVLGVSVDETTGPLEMPRDYVLRLAEAKADAGRRQVAASAFESGPVLAADTAVVIDETILGKPRDSADGLRMLRLLSGKTHEVVTAIALATADAIVTRVSRSEVEFRAIGEAEAREYWGTGEPCDKAGGYAVQGRGAIFIARLQGSYSGVMGLPLYETAELLRTAGVPRWRVEDVGRKR